MSGPITFFKRPLSHADVQTLLPTYAEVAWGGATTETQDDAQIARHILDSKTEECVLGCISQLKDQRGKGCTQTITPTLIQGSYEIRAANLLKQLVALEPKLLPHVEVPKNYFPDLTIFLTPKFLPTMTDISSNASHAQKIMDQMKWVELEGPVLQAALDTFQVIAQNEKNAPRFRWTFVKNQLHAPTENRPVPATKIKIADENIIFFSCPQTDAERQDYWDIAAREGATVLGSLHDDADHKQDGELFRFWLPPSLPQGKLFNGWTVPPSPTECKFHAEVAPEGMPKKTSEIWKTVLSAQSDTGEIQEISHHHYRGWGDKTAVPNMDALWSMLMDMAKTDSRPAGAVSIFNCMGSISRSGVSAVCFAILKHVLAKRKKGTPLDQIAINVEEILASMRRERPEMVNQTQQFGAIFKFLEMLYQHCS